MSKNEIDADWFRNQTRYRTLQDVRTLHALAFQAGARWGIQTSAELSPHIARFIELLVLLGIREDADAIR